MTTSAPAEMPLWPEDALVASTLPERWFDLPGEPSPLLRNVSRPSLTAYLPDPARATGSAVVICPGGAHHLLAMIHEGADLALWLNQRGVAAFVLKYRLLPTPDDHAEFLRHLQTELPRPGVMQALALPHAQTVLADGQRAVSLVRSGAPTWGVRPDRIGLLGFSAGGHLAGLVAARHDPDSRPDFFASIYGAHWNGLQLPEHPMPLFVMYASDDPLGETITGSGLELYRLWQNSGAPAELHAYARGGHGFGMRAQGLPSDQWPEHFYRWMQAEGLLG